MTLEALEPELMSLGFKKYMCESVFTWLHKRNASSFEQMTDISKQNKCLLEGKYCIPSLKIEKRLASKVDFAVKYLYKFFDGALVESVLLSYKHGYSLCISTQAGCKMGCSFCATGKEGFQRNLTPAEMLLQIEAAQSDNNLRISNIVLMGMGEPLDNFENVLDFLTIVSHKNGLNIGMRHISVSTCGIVDKINFLAEKKYQFTLSVSLHAPNDTIRNELMPVNKKWNVEELLGACRNYTEKTGRRISFEYALIQGVNDSRECAAELAVRLKGMLCHVNLIPVNEVAETRYRKSVQKVISDFSQILSQKGINVTVRRTLGSDIEASCGQLRNRAL